MLNRPKAAKAENPSRPMTTKGRRRSDAGVKTFGRRADDIREPNRDTLDAASCASNAGAHIAHGERAEARQANDAGKLPPHPLHNATDFRDNKPDEATKAASAEAIVAHLTRALNRGDSVILATMKEGKCDCDSPTCKGKSITVDLSGHLVTDEEVAHAVQSIFMNMPEAEPIFVFNKIMGKEGRHR